MKPHVLIVEDENLVARDLQGMVFDMGFRADTTSSGEEALRLARDLRPDVILMDIVLLKGFLDGIEVAETLHKVADLPVVYVTAHSDVDTLRRARATDPYGFVLKPVQKVELRVAIEMTLHKHKVSRQLHESMKWLEHTLRCVGDALVATDPTGNVKFLNPVAARLIETGEEDCVGQPASSFFRIEGSKTHWTADAIASVLGNGRSIVLPEDSSLVRRDGRTVPVLGSVSPIHDNFDVLLGVAAVFRDAARIRQVHDELAGRIAKMENQKRLLEVYFPENMVDYLVDRDHGGELCGKHVQATTMFFDLRGSTGIAEGLAPAQFAEFLSSYFAGVMDLTYANGGSVNKLLGDGMLITFGCPFPEESDPVNCVRLALQIREYTRAYNESRPPFLPSGVRFGIGIATGAVFAGNIGYSRRMDYTVLGDPVNVSSRLEKMTKKAGHDILIDHSTFEHANVEFDMDYLGACAIRGRSGPVRVYAPRSLA